MGGLRHVSGVFQSPNNEMNLTKPAQAMELRRLSQCQAHANRKTRGNMPRVQQQLAKKGSQKWLQQLVNSRPELLARELAPALHLVPGEQIQWLSPIRSDAYAEYSDDAFLERLNINLPKNSLEIFWPKRGPVWDGLGHTSGGDLILLEAKAHIAEMVSPPTAAGETSLPKIHESLKGTKNYLGSKSLHDWASTFYQYTNRLAHLYLLRELNGPPAYLVFLYFVNAADVAGPKTREEWEGAIKLLHNFLGINRHRLSAYVIDIYIDVGELDPSVV